MHEAARILHACGDKNEICFGFGAAYTLSVTVSTRTSIASKAFLLDRGLWQNWQFLWNQRCLPIWSCCAVRGRNTLSTFTVAIRASL